MAMFAISYVRSLIGRVFTEERAQDTFEYLLIIGGLSVAVIIAVATPVGTNLIGAVVNGTCLAVKTAVTTVTC